jgi:hypothetical protein
LVATGQETTTGRKMFQVQAVASATTPRFALIQYVDPATILPYWNYLVSSLMRIGLWSPTGNSVRIKMRLIYNTNAGLPPAIGATEPIASWAVGGDPVFSANWAQVIPQNDPAYVLPNYNSNKNGPYMALPFNNIQMPSAATGTQALGIVIYTVDPLVSTSGSQDSIIFDKVSLAQNEFAIDTPPQTFDDVLRECQFYYQNTFVPGFVPGSLASADSPVYFPQQAFNNGSGTYFAFAAPFSIEYSLKRASAAVVNTYSPSTGAVGYVDALLCYVTSAPAIITVTNPVAVGTYWTKVFGGKKGAGYIPIAGSPAYIAAASAATANIYSAVISFQFTVNALLGAPTGIP